MSRVVLRPDWQALRPASPLLMMEVALERFTSLGSSAAIQSPPSKITAISTSPQVHVAAFFGCAAAATRLEITDGQITAHGDTSRDAVFLRNLEAGRFCQDHWRTTILPVSKPISETEAASLHTTPVSEADMSEATSSPRLAGSSTPQLCLLDPPH